MTEISDEELDEWLRRDLAAEPDDGFSAHVMRALRPRQRSWLLPAATLVGTLGAWLTLLPVPVFQQAAHEWLARDIGATSALVCAVLLGFGLLCCIWALEEAQ